MWRPTARAELRLRENSLELGSSDERSEDREPASTASPEGRQRGGEQTCARVPRGRSLAGLACLIVVLCFELRTILDHGRGVEACAA